MTDYDEGIDDIPSGLGSGRNGRISSYTLPLPADEYSQVPEPFESFSMRKTKLYGRCRTGQMKRITNLSDLDCDPISYCMTDPNDQVRKAVTMLSFSEFFVQANVTLSRKPDGSGMTCANIIKECDIEEEDFMLVADCHFLYRFLAPRAVVAEGPPELVPGTNIEKVHLNPKTCKEEVVLESNHIYSLACSDDECCLLTPFCEVCRGSHNLTESPCKNVMRFMTADARLRRRIRFAADDGAAVLHIHPDGSSELRTSVCCEYLCEPCREEAIEEGNSWFRLHGTCEEEKCPNIWDEDYFEDYEEADCYVYIPECDNNNLPHDDIANALEDGRIVMVKAAKPLSASGQSKLYRLCQMAWNAFRQDANLSLSDLQREVGVSPDEVLALAMYCRRFGDFLREYKGFTLSKVNGILENPEMPKTGFWVSNRIVKDKRGRMWHIPQEKPIVVNTEGEISRISEVRATLHKSSDALGEFVT